MLLCGTAGRAALGKIGKTRRGKQQVNAREMLNKERVRCGAG